MAERLSDERRGWVERYLERYGEVEELLRHWHPGTLEFARAVGLTWEEVRQCCAVGVCRAAGRWNRTEAEFLDKKAGRYVIPWMRRAVQDEANARNRHGAVELLPDHEAGCSRPGAVVTVWREGFDFNRLWLDHVLGRATPEERSIFVLRYNDLFGGKRHTAAQVAAQFGVPLGRVRWAVKKVVERCRRGLGAKVRSL